MQDLEDREDAYIERIVAAAPPLTAAQTATLQALFDAGDQL